MNTEKQNWQCGYQHLEVQFQIMRYDTYRVREGRKTLVYRQSKNERRMDLGKMWTLSPRSLYPLQLQGNHRKKLGCFRISD